MKRFCTVLVSCVMFLWVVPAYGGQRTELPPVVESIIHNRDFFAQHWALWGYEDHYLYDIARLGDERVGVSLIAPSGFEVTLVYDVNMRKVIYHDSFLSGKTRRETLKHESVSVADAVKLAKHAVGYKSDQHK